VTAALEILISSFWTEIIPLQRPKPVSRTINGKLKARFGVWIPLVVVFETRADVFPKSDSG